MQRRWLVLAVVAIIVAGCGPSAPPAVPTWEGFTSNACEALAIHRKVLDSVGFGGGSELARVLGEAVRTRNVERATEVAATIVAELERARQYAGAAGAWPPGAAFAFHLDQMLVAEETMVLAQVQRARRDPNAPSPDAAYRVAGGPLAEEAMNRDAEALEADLPPDARPWACEDGPPG